MTDEQINIAIAEACGWRNIRELDDLYPDGSVAAGVWWQGKSPEGDSDQLLPDYLDDLNSMHEAEKVLQQNMAKWWNYVAQLAVVNAALGHGGEAHATARQRAEAFLRTVGKWEEEGGK